MYCIIVTVVAIAYICCDVNYYIRLLFTILISRLFQKKCGVNATTSIYGFCTTQDSDMYLDHMNNARYLRELDFARVHFYDRNGMFENILKMGGYILQGAASIRYRRKIPIFKLYRIETKIVYWEKNILYLEQKFITLNDGFIRAITLSRQHLVNADLDTLFRYLGVGEKPECPGEIRHWIRSIEVSSGKLRRKD